MTAPDTPPLTSQLASAAAAAARVVAAAATGEPVLATQAEADRRLAVCVACPSGLYLADKRRCAACGCVLGYKAWLATEACPKGYW